MGGRDSILAPNLRSGEGVQVIAECVVDNSPRSTDLVRAGGVRQRRLDWCIGSSFRCCCQHTPLQVFQVFGILSKRPPLTPPCLGYAERVYTLAPTNYIPL